MKRPAKDGDEEDAFYAKRWFHWRPGERKKAKRKANRRERRKWKQGTSESRALEC